MKKWFSIMFVFILVFSLAAITAPQSAKANGAPVDSGIAPGNWDVSMGTFSVLPQYTLVVPAAPWLQLLSDGITITTPTTICHEFRGGQFGWIGEIRKLEGDKWIKLVTTVKWVPDTEGKLMACAYAPQAGTYALWGYYDPEQVPEDTGIGECSEYYIGGYTWIWGPDFTEMFFIFDVGEGGFLDDGYMISYQVLDTVPDEGFSGALSGTHELVGGHFTSGLFFLPPDPPIVMTVRFTFEQYGCYIDDEWDLRVVD